MKKLIIVMIIVAAALAAAKYALAYNPVFSIDGASGVTQTISAADTVKTLANLSTSIYTAGNPVAVLITCESYNIRFAFGANPSGSFGHILYNGQAIRLTNSSSIRTFRFINDTAGSNAVLHVTPEY